LKLKFEKPICFFDLESTGLSTATDRIVSISVLKVFPDGSKEAKNAVVNPTIPIPKGASDVHGITDEMVKDKPTFKQIAKAIYGFMQNCDIAGFNSNYYDIPLLAEEFLRCEIDFPLPSSRFIDVGNIFKKKEQRTLSAALKFYCGKELENAHDAQADTLATYEVFCSQLEKYEDLSGQDVTTIEEFSRMGDKVVDFAGKIGIDADGDYYYTFGKSKGTKVKNDLSFAYWMSDKSFFTLNTKRVVERIIEELTAAPKQTATAEESSDLPF
jgi:DNA polymerase III subunit epsilon